MYPAQHETVIDAVSEESQENTQHDLKVAAYHGDVVQQGLVSVQLSDHVLEELDHFRLGIRLTQHGQILLKHQFQLDDGLGNMEQRQHADQHQRNAPHLPVRQVILGEEQAGKVQRNAVSLTEPQELWQIVQVVLRYEVRHIFQPFAVQVFRRVQSAGRILCAHALCGFPELFPKGCRRRVGFLFRP